MIITMTGKPCSGKSVVIAYMMGKYGFKRFSTGEIFRKIATDRGIDVLELNRQHDVSVDKIVDDELIKAGERDIDKDIIFDSRTAWHFIPKSFKVFIDIDDETAGERLLNANRETEKHKNLTEAISSLKTRWNIENSRYQELYNIDNLNMSNYDLIITSKDKTPEEIVEKINVEYKKFIKNQTI